MSKRENKYNFDVGVALVLGLDFTVWIISIVLLFVFKRNDLITRRAIQILISLGFWQYIYVVPLMLWQIVKHKKKLAYGMFIGSLPALLINIGFFVWIAILFKDGIGL